MQPKLTRVQWLPAHPSAGAVSMLRHWQELDAVFRAKPELPLEIACPLGAPPVAAPVANRFQRAWAKYAVYPVQTRLAGPADVVHILDHSFAHLLDWIPRRSFKIVTVHDLAPLDDASLSQRQRARFRRTLSCLNRADLLLPVSEFTATALRSFLTAAPPISVLPQGVDFAKFSHPQSAPELALPPEPRVLSIGSVVSRKNLGSLPDLLAPVVREIGPISLVRVGEPLPAELRARLEAVLGAERVREVGFVDETQLVAIYQACAALLFPSTLEGFGFPLLEAMAAGCPVVSSNASSLPEVGGAAALYFDPQDRAEGARQLVNALRDATLRASMIDRGRARARELSWDAHAERLAAIYARAGGDAKRNS
jgi:glycosyltransferase involved in cell wall biosynthesis